MNKPSLHSSPSQKLVTFFPPSRWNNPSVAIAMMHRTHFCPAVVRERSQRRSGKVMSSLAPALRSGRSEGLVGNVRMANTTRPPEGLMSSCVGAERERHGLRPAAVFHRFHSWLQRRDRTESPGEDSSATPLKTTSAGRIHYNCSFLESSYPKKTHGRGRPAGQNRINK